MRSIIDVIAYAGATQNHMPQFAFYTISTGQHYKILMDFATATKQPTAER